MRGPMEVMEPVATTTATPAVAIPMDDPSSMDSFRSLPPTWPTRVGAGDEGAVFRRFGAGSGPGPGEAGVGPAEGPHAGPPRLRLQHLHTAGRGCGELAQDRQRLLQGLPTHLHRLQRHLLDQRLGQLRRLTQPPRRPLH